MKSETELRGDALAQLAELGRVSIPHAAVLMGVHPHSLRKYVKEREVNYFMIGKRPWIMAGEIERWNKEGKRSKPLSVFEEAELGDGHLHEYDSSKCPSHF